MAGLFYDYKKQGYFTEVPFEKFDEKKISDFIKKITQSRKVKATKIAPVLKEINDRITILDTFKGNKNAQFSDAATIKKNFAQGLSASELETFVANFNSINDAEIDSVLVNLKSAKAALEAIYRRYNKEDICIGIVGAKRIGKSTFITSITGLSEAVVPVSPDGKPCTGVSSIIRNRNQVGTTAIITYYSIEEFEELFNKYKTAYENEGVNVANITFGKQGFLDLYNAVSQMRIDKLQFKSRLLEYYQHYDMIMALISKGKDELTSEIEIEKKVAYTVNGKTYLDFLAVKKAEIFTKFAQTDIENITLIDTIGFGELSLGVQEKAADVVAFESDFVIVASMIDQTAVTKGTGTIDTEIKNTTLGYVKDEKGSDIYCPIGLQNTDCNKWLFSVVNRYPGVKQTDIDDKIQAIEALFQGNNSPAGYIDVSFIDKDEIKEKVIIPALQYIYNNVGEIDNGFEKEIKNALGIANASWNALVSKIATATLDNSTMDQTIQQLAVKKANQVRAAFVALLSNYQTSPPSETIKSINKKIEELETYIVVEKGYLPLEAIMRSYESTQRKINGTFAALEFETDKINHSYKEIMFEKIKEITGLGDGFRYSVVDNSFDDFSRTYFNQLNQPSLMATFNTFASSKIDIGALVSTVKAATAAHLDPNKGNGNIPARWNYETIYDKISDKLEIEQIVKIRGDIQQNLHITSPEEQIYAHIRTFLQGLSNVKDTEWVFVYGTEAIAKVVFRDELAGITAGQVNIAAWNNIVAPFNNQKHNIELFF